MESLNYERLWIRSYNDSIQYRRLVRENLMHAVRQFLKAEQIEWGNEEEEKNDVYEFIRRNLEKDDS